MCDQNYSGHCGCGEPMQVRRPAPDFTMEGFYKGEMKNFSLSDYRGRWVVLFFYPLDFTFVCPTELVELSRRHQEFEEVKTQVLGVSVDSVYSHQAWLKELGDFSYPLLSDITKRVSKKYNVLLSEKGISLRGAFIIDPEGVLRSQMVNDLDVGRNIDEILRVVCAFQTGERCPVGWTKGKATLGKD